MPQFEEFRFVRRLVNLERVSRGPLLGKATHLVTPADREWTAEFQPARAGLDDSVTRTTPRGDRNGPRRLRRCFASRFLGWSPDTRRRELDPQWPCHVRRLNLDVVPVQDLTSFFRKWSTILKESSKRMMLMGDAMFSGLSITPISSAKRGPSSYIEQSS